MNLVYKNERSLFVLSLILSLVFWLLLVVGTLGIALIYLLIGAIAYAFAQSAFISYIKGTAVKVTPEQFPDLHARLEQCCEALKIKYPPDMYLLHADGAFNAFATRFFGRNFIALYSDVVDALEDRGEAINFYIGHELGHIARGHLVWAPVLWPASILPLLGPAYSRAKEYTCDNYGLACCKSAQDAEIALAAIAAGSRRWATLNLPAYAAQAAGTGGFWMSFHELVADYPWLVKRVARLSNGNGSLQQKIPTRNPLAWLLALFVPRLGVGGGAGSMLVVVAIIGILAAVAIPAYQDYTHRAQVQAAFQRSLPVRDAIEAYIYRHQAFPESLEELAVDAGADGALESLSLGETELVLTFSGALGVHRGETLVWNAYPDDGQIIWECTGGTLPHKLRPIECRD